MTAFGEGPQTRPGAKETPQELLWGFFCVHCGALSSLKALQPVRLRRLRRRLRPCGEEEQEPMRFLLRHWGHEIVVTSPGVAVLTLEASQEVTAGNVVELLRPPTSV